MCAIIPTRCRNCSTCSTKPERPRTSAKLWNCWPMPACSRETWRAPAIFTRSSPPSNPQNPLHMQNYQQVVSQLGGTSGSKLITPEEAVVLIDDLEATAPSVHQHYSDEVALAIRSALTDAELFISYNMPAKALGPLVGALPMAPNDLRMNQRLAALHTRAGRFAEAGVCCRTLQTRLFRSGLSRRSHALRRAGRTLRRSFLGACARPACGRGSDLSGRARASRRSPSREAEIPCPSFPSTKRPAKVRSRKKRQSRAAPEAEAASPWPTSADAERNHGRASRNEFAVVDESTRRLPSRPRPPKSIFPRNGTTSSRLKPMSPQQLRKPKSPKPKSPSAAAEPRSSRPARSTRRSKKFASIWLTACPSRPWRPWPSCRL